MVNCLINTWVLPVKAWLLIACDAAFYAIFIYWVQLGYSTQKTHAWSGFDLGGGGEGGNLRVILVRVCGPVFETYPNHIPGLRKKMTYSYTWLNRMFTYSYTVLWFLFTLFAVCKQRLQINITILVSELNIWAKNMNIIKHTCQKMQKMGPFI